MNQVGQNNHRQKGMSLDRRSDQKSDWDNVGIFFFVKEATPPAKIPQNGQVKGKVGMHRFSWPYVYLPT